MTIASYSYDDEEDGKGWEVGCFLLDFFYLVVWSCAGLAVCRRVRAVSYLLEENTGCSRSLSPQCLYGLRCNAYVPSTPLCFYAHRSISTIFGNTRRAPR